MCKGFDYASGKYVLFADGDDSYDFYEIDKFWGKKDKGDMILGSRFKGTIYKGAMPSLHRYFGTPFLTFILNVLYNSKISDFQSGMRMCKKIDLDKFDFECSGMEFASEILIKYLTNNLEIYEIPISLHKDGQKNHKPHLRPLETVSDIYFESLIEKLLFFIKGYILVSKKNNYAASFLLAFCKINTISF